MKLRSIACVIAGVGSVVALAWAGIPEPDAILYGYVSIGGARQTVADNVTVFATLGTATDPKVGKEYKLGDYADVGDRYVLRIELESLAYGGEKTSNREERRQQQAVLPQHRALAQESRDCRQTGNNRGIEVENLS